MDGRGPQLAAGRVNKGHHCLLPLVLSRDALGQADVLVTQLPLPSNCLQQLYCLQQVAASNCYLSKGSAASCNDNIHGLFSPPWLCAAR
jgi:hypothetical protein